MGETSPDLHGELRRLYREAFHRLESQDRVEEAAFLLAEGLHAHEEAVSFLERHGRLRLAAAKGLTVLKPAEATDENAYAVTADVMTSNMLAHDAEEGIDAFLEKRPPVWSGT